MNNTSLIRITATAGTYFGQDLQIKNSQCLYFIQNFMYNSYTQKPLFFLILPSCWFSRQTIDQYSPLLYNSALGFFQSQCGRSTSQSRLPKLELDIFYYSSGFSIYIFKRIFIFLSCLLYLTAIINIIRDFFFLT